MRIRFCEFGVQKMDPSNPTGFVLFHGSGSQKIPGLEPVDPEDPFSVFEP